MWSVILISYQSVTNFSSLWLISLYGLATIRSKSLMIVITLHTYTDLYNSCNICITYHLTVHGNDEICPSGRIDEVLNKMKILWLLTSCIFASFCAMWLTSLPTFVTGLFPYGPEPVHSHSQWVIILHENVYCKLLSCTTGEVLTDLYFCFGSPNSITLF